MRLQTLVGWPIARRSAIHALVAVEVDRSSRAMRIFHLALLGASSASLSVLRALFNKAVSARSHFPSVVRSLPVPQPRGSSGGIAGQMETGPTEIACMAEAKESENWRTRYREAYSCSTRRDGVLSTINIDRDGLYGVEELTKHPFDITVTKTDSPNGTIINLCQLHAGLHLPSAGVVRRHLHRTMPVGPNFVVSVTSGMYSRGCSWRKE